MGPQRALPVGRRTESSDDESGHGLGPREILYTARVSARHPRRRSAVDALQSTGRCKELKQERGTKSVPPLSVERAYVASMKAYGQFCSMARSLDLLGERWTLLIVRELLCGSQRFGDIRHGIPRVSRTMLSARLRELVDSGIVERREHDGDPTYALTQAGRELSAVVEALGTWGQRWLPRDLPKHDLDSDTLVWDMRRRVNMALLPARPVVARLELVDVAGREGARFLLLRRSEVSICAANPGFPDVLRVRAHLRTMTAWWRGDLSIAEARAAGMTIEGPRELVRAFPRWFERYMFAKVPPAQAT